MRARSYGDVMTLGQLASRLSGALLLPGSDGFDEARNFHGRPGSPTAVVQAADVADVAAAVSAARVAGLPVAVRSGGHGMWESVPDALVIDLRALRDVEVAGSQTDGTRLVRVGGGATWGEVAEVLGPHQLAISSGDTRSVGVGGLTLGGGIGWLVRCCGLALDQLAGVQLVTAAGEVIEASDDRHPDLFWAVRGGGGNFGVATRFDFRATALAGLVHASLTLADGPLTGPIRAFRDVMRVAPRELNGSLVRTPAMGPDLPARTMVELAWAGTDEAAAQAAFAPLLALPDVASSEIGPVAYADLLEERPTPPADMELPTIADANGWCDDLSDEAVEEIVAAFEAAGGQLFLVRWLGGAFADVDPEATAIAFRDAEAFVLAAAFVFPGSPEEEHERVVAALGGLDRHSRGMYGNFTNAVTSGLAERMYPPGTLARLREIKREWDPGNLFSRNHNVTPS